MTGVLATFGIAAAGTVLGLIIARFSRDTQDRATKSMQELEERQRQVLDEVRDIRQRLEQEKQTSSQETGVLL